VRGGGVDVRGTSARIAFVLAVTALSTIGPLVIGSQEPPSFTATARLESQPGSVWGVRALQDHYVEAFDPATGQPPPVELPVSATATIDGLEPWDPLFEVETTARTAADAKAAAEAVVAWIVDDSLSSNRAADDRDIAALSAELATAEADFASAEQAAAAAPDDADARHARDALRNRITSLGQRLDDAELRAEARVTSVAVTRVPLVSEDDRLRDDAVVAGVVGLLLSTAAVVAFRR
jgi:hypothetical protein